MAISLCVFTPFIHCLLSSLLQFSISRLHCSPAPLGSHGTVGAALPLAGAAFAMRWWVPSHPLSLCLQVTRSRQKRKLPGLLWKSETGGNQTRFMIPAQKLSTLSRICPGSNFLSGLWEPLCRLCVSVHLFPCLSTHVYLFPSCLSFSHSGSPPHALSLYLSLSLSGPHLSHPHLPLQYTFVSIFLLSSVSPFPAKISHRNGNPSHSPPPCTGLLPCWLVLPPPQIKGRDGERR